MKKYLYLLLIPLLGFLPVSCNDDDDDIPDVSISAEVSGGVIDNNTLYAVQGDIVNIDAITLDNRTGKDGAVGVVNYYIDGVSVAQSFVAPFGLTIDTGILPVGNHLVTADMPIYVVDYPICWGVLNMKLAVVESADDLPGEPATARIGGVIKEK